ncbi:hypothetical protein [Ornithinimicrobium kibberense]|uniref:hypothetical protein n=1 Tax=Ornithinimicrobium kibberense TaxID=282060 RepID=UPI0036142405
MRPPTYLGPHGIFGCPARLTRAGGASTAGPARADARSRRLTDPVSAGPTPRPAW